MGDEGWRGAEWTDRNAFIRGVGEENKKRIGGMGPIQKFLTEAFGKDNLKNTQAVIANAPAEVKDYFRRLFLEVSTGRPTGTSYPWEKKGVMPANPSQGTPDALSAFLAAMSQYGKVSKR